MTQLALNVKSPAATMSSREIAELTGKRHDQVLRTARDLLGMGVTQSVETQYVHEQNGQQYPEHRLSKRDSLILVARLSPEFTAKVVDRWMELEAQASQPRELTRMELLQLAIDSEQQRLELADKLALAAPKAAFVDQYVQAEGSMTFRQVAKLLRANESRLRDLLVSGHVVYYLNGRMTPYQPQIDAGRCEIKTGISDRNNRAFAHLHFTPKGVQWVAGLWAKSMMQEAV